MHIINIMKIAKLVKCNIIDHLLTYSAFTRSKPGLHFSKIIL